MKFEIGDLVLMDSPEWPYLNQIGKIESTYINGANKLTFTVSLLSNPLSRVGINPELCVDARPILRDIKLEQLITSKIL